MASKRYLVEVSNLDGSSFELEMEADLIADWINQNLPANWAAAASTVAKK